MSDLAKTIAQEMGLVDDDVEAIKIAASIHDIGKIGIPAEVLSKVSTLTVYEIAMLRTHAQAGYDIVKPLQFKTDIAKTILQHHERLDGSGYPNQLKGDEICLEAKVLAVADVVEAICSDRPYRAGRGIDVALQEITTGRDKQYDPDAVDACLRLFKNKGYELPPALGAKFHGLSNASGTL